MNMGLQSPLKVLGSEMQYFSNETTKECPDRSWSLTIRAVYGTPDIEQRGLTRIKATAKVSAMLYQMTSRSVLKNNLIESNVWDATKGIFRRLLYVCTPSLR